MYVLISILHTCLLFLFSLFPPMMSFLIKFFSPTHGKKKENLTKKGFLYGLNMIHFKEKKPLGRNSLEKDFLVNFLYIVGKHF